MTEFQQDPQVPAFGCDNSEQLSHTIMNLEDAFTVVGADTSISKQITDKQAIVGVQVTRTMHGDSSFSNCDMKCILKMVAEVDPDAIFLNYAKNHKKAKFLHQVISEAKTMDLNGSMDVQTFPWEHPKNNKTRTTFLFHVATDVISRNLRELKQHPQFDDYCRLGRCMVQPSQLRQSRSKMIGLLSGKDVRYTNRIDMADRIARHLHNHTEDCDIPVNIVPLNENGIRVLGFTVGINDAAKTLATLDKHPFEDIEIILHSWKRSNREAYNQRLHQHWKVVQHSHAFKFEDMDPAHIPMVRQTLQVSPAKDYIVDVSPAMHAAKTGTAYVQYLRPHREIVLGELHRLLEQPTNPEGPFADKEFVMATPDESTTPTMVTDGSLKRRPTVPVPVGRFANIPMPLGMTVPSGRQPPAPSVNRVPTSAGRTKPKSYCRVLMDGANSSDSDEETVITSNSKGDSSLSSKTSKSKREIELEIKNEELMQTIQTQQEQLLTQQEKLQTQQDQHETQQEQFHQEVRKLKEQQAKMQREHAQQIDMLQRQLAELTQATHQDKADSPSRQPNKRNKPSTPGTMVQKLRQGIDAMSLAIAPMNTDQEPFNHSLPAQPTPEVPEGVDRIEHV